MYVFLFFSIRVVPVYVDVCMLYVFYKRVVVAPAPPASYNVQRFVHS